MKGAEGRGRGGYSREPFVGEGEGVPWHMDWTRVSEGWRGKVGRRSGNRYTRLWTRERRTANALA
jgi:hypothetical protein